MTDIFDLEQGILDCWGIVDDIDVLRWRINDGEQLTEDELENFLLGLQSIYGIKFQKLFDTFEHTINNNEPTADEDSKESE